MVEREWLALRSPAAMPNNRQISAIAGLAYAEVVTPTLQDEPGAPAIWSHGVRRHEADRDDPELRAAGRLEQWLGPSLDGYARAFGTRIADVDRPRVLDAVKRATTICRRPFVFLPSNKKGFYSRSAM